MYRFGLLDLEAVLAISRKGSFRAAALDLGMSTTALSNTIGKLEKEVGVRLFNRTTRSVSLTDAGRMFVDQIAPPLQDIRNAMDGVRSRQAIPSGTIRINTFAMAAREILSPLILDFLREYPRVHIDLVTEGRMVDIVAEGFDLGVRTADLIPNDMIAVPLGRPQRHAVVGSPHYFELHDKPQIPPDLIGHSCIRVRLPNRALYRWHFTKGDQSAQIDVEGRITLDEASLARTAVLEGIGLGFFIEANIREDIEAGRLIRVLDDWTPPLSPLCLYYSGRRNPSAALAAFISLARKIGAKTSA
ncbi:MAG: LysR family transcriptional regulator [Fulvimarina manganoxydans]|uniref:LysR family transcriptional regulator n=1 Tax=Fulvimarina manganoxydans TaxID=937218 RepID=UPI002357B729|nr:LysR family transcriptional regulator [Fulvimarina manganoxydans]MCK5932694.1 LysR family transcriptional regulator [Fulvimarina manganoxydans]